MSTTEDQQRALDNELVPMTKRLPFAENNLRLKDDFDPLQPAFKVAMDMLDISPIRKALRATSSVPETYMHEFWISAQDKSPSEINFTIDRKQKTLTIAHFRTIFGFTPLAQGEKYDKPPTKSQLVELITNLGYAENIRTLSEFHTTKLGQPWKALFNIIIRCLTGKSSGKDTLRLPQAQIFWGLYNAKRLDYASLIWAEFYFQGVKNTKKKSDHLQFPRFTKLIIDHFMKEYNLIDRRGQFFYHTSEDDYILKMMQAGVPNIKSNVLPAPVPDTMINEAIKESKAYKDLLKAIARQAKRAESEKTAEASTPTKGKDIKKKREAKLFKAEKAKKMILIDEDKDDPTTLSVEQHTEILLKRSKKETLHASGSGHPSKDTEESENESFGDPDAKTDSEHEEEDREPEGQNDDEDDERQAAPNSDDIKNEDTEFHNQDTELNQEGGGNEDMDTDHDEFSDDVNVNNPGRIKPTGSLLIPEDAHLTVIPATKDQSKSTSGSDLVNKVFNFCGPAEANEATNTDPSTNMKMEDVPVTLAPAIVIPPSTTPLIGTIATIVSTTPQSTGQPVPSTSRSTFKLYDDVDFMLRCEQRMKAQADETARINEELARHLKLEETYKKHQEDKLAKLKKKIVRLQKMKKQYNKDKKILAQENDTFIKSINDQMQDIIHNEVQESLNKERPALRKEMKELAASKFLIKSSGTPESEYSIAKGLTDFELKKILHSRMIEVGSYNKTPTQRKLHDILQQAIDEDNQTFKEHGSVVPYKTYKRKKSVF